MVKRRRGQRKALPKTSPNHPVAVDVQLDMEVTAADPACLEVAEEAPACLEVAEEAPACLEEVAEEAAPACLEVAEEVAEEAPACLEVAEEAPACLEVAEEAAAPACLEVAEEEAAPACLEVAEAAPACLEVAEAAPACLEVAEEAPACLEIKSEDPEPRDSAQEQSGNPAVPALSTRVAASPGSYHRYDASEDSSDSDVTIVLPHKPKRRRLLPGTVPMEALVYSNKVNSCLKLLPDDVSTMAELEKAVEKKQGYEDLRSEAVAPALPVSKPRPVPSDTEDVDSQQPEVVHERIRNSSPSPPPSPNTPVNQGRNRNQGRKRGLTRKIRKMEACLLDLGTVLSPQRSRFFEDNDVIMVGTSTVPEITIKVRRRGKIFRVNIRVTDPLQRLVESVAAHLEVNPAQILLMRGDEELNTKETPKSTNLSVADIIDCMILSTSGGQGTDAEHSEICLKIQGKDKESQLTVTIGMDEPLKSLMDRYKAAMGLSRKVCFMFEGRKLKGQNTASQLGLESDDIIEAWT
ncbi:NFATC2-interacting protein-like [Mantella aurantiaca]